MQVNYRAYPHPVLSYFSDDYVRCLYQTNITSSISRNAYQFTVVSKTSSRGLLNLIRAGLAKHAIHIECPATRYRRIFTSTDETFSVEVKSDELEGRVNLCSFIIANADIQEFASDEFHPDFGGRSFTVRKGDVLAVDKDRNFVAEKEHDPLRKLPSIFTISLNHSSQAPSIDVDITGHKIAILLSEEMHTLYRKLAADTASPHILSSMVVIPVLVSLLESISTGQVADYEERRWYRVLLNKLNNAGYAISSNGFADSTIVIAQKLIGDPLLLGARNLWALLSETEEE